jgi:hypothetical protein
VTAGTTACDQETHRQARTTGALGGPMAVDDHGSFDEEHRAWRSGCCGRRRARRSRPRGAQAHGRAPPGSRLAISGERARCRDDSHGAQGFSPPRGRAGEWVPRRRGSEARGVPQRSGAKRHEAGLTDGDSTQTAGLRPGRTLRSSEARGRAPRRPGPRGNPEHSARADHASTWAQAI